MLKPQYFVFFLKGVLRVNGDAGFNEYTTKLVKEALDECFEHVVESVKPTLQELIPEHDVYVAPPNWNKEKHPVPANWHKGFEYSSFHGWYDPAYGRPRC